ncbi:MAG: glycosyltransferase family 39 protein, partial [Anaerolineaceae bacterium]
IALIVEFTLPISYPRPSFSDAPVLASLTGSDSIFLLGIAANGYHALPIQGAYLDWAFFPLYPLVVRFVSLLTFGDLAIAGVLVANLAALAGAWLLYRIGEPRFGHRRALLAVVYLLIAPGAVAFGMAYTDSLFLLLALVAFGAAQRGRWWLMGSAYHLATLTRLPGIFLAIPLILVILASDKRSWRAALPLVLGPAALGGFTFYLWRQFGVWFAYLQAQVAWNSPPGVAPGGGIQPGVEPLVVLLTLTLILYIFLLVYARPDRLDAGSIAFMLVSIGTALGSLRLLSVARYLGVVWPFSWILAGRGGFVPYLWPALSGALFALYAVLHFTQALAP